MDYHELLHKVESSTSDDWTAVDTATPDGHHVLYVFHEDVAITLAYGADHMDGDSWTETWSTRGGFPDNKIYGSYLDVRYNGVLVHRDLVLMVDGARGILPSGKPITDDANGIVGMRVSEPEMKRAQLLDELRGHRDFERYVKSAGIRVQ